MNRCATMMATAALAWLSLSGTAALAEVLPRTFPATALRGELRVVQPPEVLLNGQPARLSPGSRIRDRNNMLQLSGGLVDQPLRVNYTVDSLGNVHMVWILTDAEAAKRPWPTTAEQAASWQFNPSEQTWTRR